MTYANVEELLNGVYAVFGKGVRVVQWGDWYEAWEVTRVERTPVTV